MIGSPVELNIFQASTGNVFVYEFLGQSQGWTYQAALDPGTPDDGFGSSISMSNNYTAVGSGSGTA